MCAVLALRDLLFGPYLEEGCQPLRYVVRNTSEYLHMTGSYGHLIS